MCFLAFHLFISHSQLVCGFSWTWKHRSAQCNCPTFGFVQSLSNQCACTHLLSGFYPHRKTLPGPWALSPAWCIPSFLPFSLIFSPAYLSSVLFSCFLDARLDWEIEPRMSQSGKTRYRGCFMSRAFSLVYQKPWVIRFWSDLPETLSDPIERNDFEVRAERSWAVWLSGETTGYRRYKRSLYDSGVLLLLTHCSHVYILQSTGDVLKQSSLLSFLSVLAHFSQTEFISHAQ